MAKHDQVYVVREYVQRKGENFLRTHQNYTQTAPNAYEALRISGVLGGMKKNLHGPAITPNETEYFLGWIHDPHHFILVALQEDYTKVLDKTESRIKKELAPKRARKKSPTAKTKLDNIMAEVDKMEAEKNG